MSPAPSHHYPPVSGARPREVAETDARETIEVTWSGFIQMTPFARAHSRSHHTSNSVPTTFPPPPSRSTAPVGRAACLIGSATTPHRSRDGPGRARGFNCGQHISIMLNISLPATEMSWLGLRAKSVTSSLTRDGEQNVPAAYVEKGPKSCMNQRTSVPGPGTSKISAMQQPGDFPEQNPLCRGPVRTGRLQIVTSPIDRYVFR